MFKFIAFLFIILATSSFKISDIKLSSFLSSISEATTPSESTFSAQKVQQINYPFKIIEEKSWAMISLTLNVVPAKGSSVKMTLKARGKTYFSFKQYELITFLNDLYLHSQVTPYFGDYVQGEVFEFVYSFNIPEFAPSGKIGLQFRYKDTDGNSNGAWEMNFKI